VSRWFLVLALACAAVAGCAKASQGDPDGAAGDDTPDGEVAPPDANNCATQPCDILTQCGCESTQACDIDISDIDGTACRAIDATGTETSACEGITSCDRGFVCLGPVGGSACKRYCDDNLDCAQPRGMCVIDITDGTNPIPGIPSVCSSNCNPANVAAGGCPAGFKCGLFTQTHDAVTYDIADCTLAGAGGQGASCTGTGVGDDSLCSANTLCTTLNGTTFNCRRVCTASSGGPECGGSQDCLSFDPPFMIAGTEYGVCD
jgi:hypothetical protein